MKKPIKDDWREQKYNKDTTDIGVTVKTSRKDKQVLKIIKALQEEDIKKEACKFAEWCSDKEYYYLGNGIWQYIEDIETDKSYTTEELYDIFKKETK